VIRRYEDPIKELGRGTQKQTPDAQTADQRRAVRIGKGYQSNEMTAEIR
jgi:hypothetical protein